MSAYTLPAPRRISLQRVKFKRPRWPRGNRIWLGVTIYYALWLVFDVATGDWSFHGAPWDVALGGLSFGLWLRSRRDDDGPSAT